VGILFGKNVRLFMVNPVAASLWHPKSLVPFARRLLIVICDPTLTGLFAQKRMSVAETRQEELLPSNRIDLCFIISNRTSRELPRLSGVSDRKVLSEG
jgi:hypothetical protein